MNRLAAFRWLVPVVAAVGYAGPLDAQSAPVATAAAAEPLQMRAHSLVAILAGDGDTATVFAPETLAQLTEAKIRAVSKHLSDGFGRPLALADLTTLDARTAKIVIRYERGTVDMTIAVEPAAPYRLIGLRVTGTASGETSLDQVVAAIEALPGAAGFALSALGDGVPTPLRASQADTPFAVGSAFKLAILAELIRAVAAGERRWDDLVTLDGKPLPDGRYTQTPAGTRVAIRELARAMIAASDNSATDILLATLGRDRVEAMLPEIGWRDAARNRPLLGMRDLFVLKAAHDGALGARWRTLDEGARRALLAGEVAATPPGAIDPRLFQRGMPTMLDIEWFASPDDLVRTLDWIRRHTESGPAAEARAILAVNPGIGPARALRWAYIGYKGGSEPGVIAMTLLLHARSGPWYALAMAWNDRAAPVDDDRFVALATRAVDLVEAGR